MRTGWDMDPFLVISIRKKVFRIRIIRHSLNPTWDEKLTPLPRARIRERLQSPADRARLG
jgi:hypothetical protein